MRRLSIFYSFLFAVATVISFSSCMESIDTSQIDDIDIAPAVEASLFYFESSEEIVNNDTGNTVYQNDFNFEAFSTEFFSERVIEGSITYVITNTTSKEFEYTIDFLDDAGMVLDSEFFSIQPAPSTVLRREIAYGPAGRDLDIIRNLSSIRVSAINLSGTTSTSSETDPKIILQSSGNFRVRLR